MQENWIKTQGFFFKLESEDQWPKPPIKIADTELLDSDQEVNRFTEQSSQDNHIQTTQQNVLARLFFVVLIEANNGMYSESAERTVEAREHEHTHFLPNYTRII